MSDGNSSFLRGKTLLKGVDDFSLLMYANSMMNRVHAKYAEWPLASDLSLFVLVTNLVLIHHGKSLELSK